MIKRLLVTLGLLGLSCLLQAEEGNDKRPNIVVYVTDDEGFHHISHYGAKVQTPAIDELAKQGVTFTQAIAPAAVCTPSRYSIMTGLYAGKNKSETFKNDNPADSPYKVTWNTFLTGQDITLHEMLSANGYYTGMVGKWHLSDMHTEALPVFSGNENLDSPSTDSKLQQYQAVVANKVKAVSGANFVANIVAENNEEIPIDRLRVHNPEWITQGAIEFLDSTTDEQPFFLVVASTNPHGPAATLSLNTTPNYTPEGKIEVSTPYHPPRENIAKRLKEQGLRVDHQNVSALFVDDQIAALQKKIKEIGQAENTVFLFVSDHNSEPGKATTYDAGVRIPMIMTWPGVIRAGTDNNNVVQVTDIFPTVLDIAGANIDLGLDGKSMLPAVLASTPLREEAYLEMGWTRAVRTERYKYIAFRYPKSVIDDMKNGTRQEAPNHLDLPNQGQPNITMQYYEGYFAADQLYDLQADPNEQFNLAYNPDYAPVLKDMKARLQRYLSTFSHPFDLEDTVFMESEAFNRLALKTLEKAPQRQPDWAGHVKFRAGPQVEK